MSKLFCITLFTVLSLGTFAQTVNTNEQQVKQTVVQMFAAIADIDTVKLKSLTTAQVRFYEYGEVWNIDTLIRKILPYKSIADFKRTNHFQFVNTTIHQKTAWVTYYLQSELMANGKQQTLHWMETVVLVNADKQWKVDVLHSTRLIKN